MMDDILKRAGDPSAWDITFFHAIRDLNTDDMMKVFEEAKGFGTYEALMTKLIEIERHEAVTPQLKPEDLTDMGQAEVFCREYGDRIRYSKETGFLKYDGARWVEDDLGAQALAQELTKRQLNEVKRLIDGARRRLDKLTEEPRQNGAAITETRAELASLEQYRKFVLTRRHTARIRATLTEAATAVAVRIEDLDKNPYLLNTPAGAVDLRTGEIKKHRPEMLLTKMTGVAPDTEGSEMFLDFLGKLTCGDAELMDYLQQMSGSCLVGAVKHEGMSIWYGSGGNGKSTMGNLMFKVSGSYAGMLSAEVFTVGKFKKNSSPEFAELRGKRLVLAPELEEGQRLNTAVVKKLCSTDPIQCEPKYRKPFSFVPSHHVILYTNHLPRVGSIDSGTWSRLSVVPFLAHFRGSSDEVKDYASELFEKCGGAVLAWMIEGARKAIDAGFKIALPQCVRDAVEEYRDENDWLRNFIDARCYTDKTYTAEAGALYQEYREYCEVNGEFSRSKSEFKTALINAGYEPKKTNTGTKYRGLRMKFPKPRVVNSDDG